MSIRAFLPSGDRALAALSDIDVPTPRVDEALVAVEAFSVNRGEIMLLASGRQDPPGKDIAGRVVGAAADGSGPAAGTRVVAHVERGGWAEQARVPTGRMATLPAEVSAQAAAALPLAGLTALRLLRTAGGVAGRRLLLTGASGGVGHYLVELAAGVGVKVTAVTSTPTRGERLLGLGADAVVTSVHEADGPFYVAIESVGGDVFGQALLKLGRDGLMLWYGQASLEPARADFFAVQQGPSTSRSAPSTIGRRPTATGRTSPRSSTWSPPAACTRRSARSPTGSTRHASWPPYATARCEATPCSPCPRQRDAPAALGRCRPWRRGQPHRQPPFMRHVREAQFPHVTGAPASMGKQHLGPR